MTNIAFYVLISYKFGYERNIKWQHLKVLLINAKNAVRILKFRNAEEKQSFVQRNVQMSIDKIIQGVKKLSCSAKAVARHFMTTLAMAKEESFVRMNVQISHISKLKNGSALIVERFLKLTHRLLIFVVLGNVELRERRLLIGHHLKRFLNNVFNVEKNFIDRNQKLRGLEENFVLANVKLIPNEGVEPFQVFMVLEFGFRFAKELLKGITRLASIVGLRAKVFMSTIKNLKEMVGRKLMIILSLFVQDVTDWSIANNTLNIFNRRNTIKISPDGVLFFNAVLSES